jgi:class 3 adenylate cyclase/FixJ family two-component response regulator
MRGGRAVAHRRAFPFDPTPAGSETAAVANILVVEDDPTIRELVRLHLASANHEVFTANDGLQGLQTAMAKLPDIIISDVQMPNMDGFGMLAAVRANTQTASIPVIFLTALDDRESFRKSMNLGADDFLSKPVKRNELLNAIAGRLRRVEDGREVGATPSPSGTDVQATATLRAADRAAAASAQAVAVAGAAEAVRTPARQRARRALDLTSHLNSMEERSPPDVRGATSRETVYGTVLFADIRNFTTMAEALEPEQVVEFLNAFFGQACEPILDQAGWIVKFLGDGLVAMFDSRSGSDDHAERALKAAVLMVLAAHRFKPWIRDRYPGKKMPEFAIGVGVHTGDVSVCRMGSGEAVETTVIGDTVNLASRLEGKTKELGWSIVASRAAVKSAGRRFIPGRSGQMSVKGRTGAVDIVEITGLTARPGADPHFYQMIVDAVASNSAIIAANRPADAPVPTQPPPPAIPRPRPPADGPISIDGYRMIRKLGEGGMSKVFLAEELETRAQHVLKLLPIPAADDEDGNEMMQRFIQEFALVSQIEHPNVARIYHQGFTDSYAYIAMEYFPGGDLRELIAKSLAPQVAVAILLQVAGALTAVHAQGIVHRDMKPDNVMIRADGSLALADFGIAKQTNSDFQRTKHGEVFGTPYYLAPEQALGMPVDQRTDIYSLGVVFFEMLTARRPFQADNAQALMYQHVNAPIPRLPAGLERYQAVVDRMMAKKQADRFGSANDLIDFVLGSGLAEG